MEIVYSASALGAFTSSLIYIAIFFILGFGNFLLMLLTRSRRKRRKIGDYVLGFISLLLIFFGALTSIAAFNTYQNGDVTVRVQAVEKREVTVRCGEYYCAEYNVETTDGKKFYVFGLEKETWDKVEVNACYQFTYYPLKPLLAGYLQRETQYPNLYEATGYITLIERVGC
ncbi:MAG: hypothetical protein HXY38_14945 [Chloroflexi bacterium]|nr:hypothetical protein [Chloroflexota bacterium]